MIEMKVLGKRVRDAEKEWIRYIYLLLDKKRADTGDCPSIRDRLTGAVKEQYVLLRIFSIMFSKVLKNKPFSKTKSINVLVSKRPQIMV